MAPPRIGCEKLLPSLAEPLAMAEVSSLEDKRARYHGTRFRGKSAAAVLHRYELQRTQMSRPQLEKHAFHVASWFLALPREEIAHDHNGLSVVTLFVRYLESLDGPNDRPVDTRLARILARVSQNILCLGDDPVRMQLQKQIRKHLPPEELVLQDCALLEEKRAESEDAEAKAVHLMQRAVQRWQNSDSRETYVSGLEQALAESEDPATLRRILRRAVAALSPPRCKGNSNGVLAYSSSQSGQPASKDLQARLRALVLACLDGLDLTDSSLAPALLCLKAHVQKFQELLESESSVASQRQWLRLQAKCAVGSAAGLPGPSACSTILCVDDNKRKRKRPECNFASDGQQETNSGRPACPHGKAKENCQQCSGCPHGRLPRNCTKCTGCKHGKRKTECRLCTPCPHGKVERHCVQCRPCPHGKLERACAQCHPCPHGRLARDCRQCSGCPHGIAKSCCRKCRVPRRIAA